jgi:hypothetical protein
MNRHVYNASILAGVALVSVGAGLVYVPAGLITGGTLMIVLTIASAYLATKGPG